MSIFAELALGITARSSEETRLIGQRLAAELPPNAVLALHGDLGVGKTTLVKGLAEGLGIQQVVTSPTFNIFTLHRGPRGILIHLDAYRLESGHQIEQLMLEDFLTPPYVLAVEWPEKIAQWLPTDALHFSLSIVSPGSHRIQFIDQKKAPSDRRFS